MAVKYSTFYGTTLFLQNASWEWRSTAATALPALSPP